MAYGTVPVGLGAELTGLVIGVGGALTQGVGLGDESAQVVVGKEGGVSGGIGNFCPVA